MLKNLFPLIISIILIAIFALLFKLSVPNIENIMAKKDVDRKTAELSEKFGESLTDREKQLINELPCKSANNICPDTTSLKNKYITGFKDYKINRALILSAEGEEIFTGKKLDGKYINLVHSAQRDNRSYQFDSSSSDMGKDEKILTVDKFSTVTGIKSVNDKYLLIQADKKKLDFSVYTAVMGVICGAPLLAMLGYFLMKTRKIKVEKEKFAGENKEFLDQLEKLKKENVQQSQFLANFTHELRTPLNSIIGFSGLLKDQTLGNLGNVEYVKYANDINTSGVHLLSLINDILDYSKSEVGKLKVNVTEVDIVKILRQSLSIVAPRASESKVELQQSFANDYFILRVDPKRLKQIMLNLLSNAVKFTPEGGSVTLAVYPDMKDEKISIEVKDTGVGIAEKDIPTVMSLFGQVETDLNRKYEGTGIGLPFAKKLTQLMGGSFDLQSQVGVGTRVTLTFPYDKKLNAEYAELFKKSSLETL